MTWIRDYQEAQRSTETPSLETCPDEWRLYMKRCCALEVMRRVLEIAISKRRMKEHFSIVDGGGQIAIFYKLRPKIYLQFGEDRLTFNDQSFPYVSREEAVNSWSHQVGVAILVQLEK